MQYFLLQPMEEPEVDSMVKALSVAMKPKYLGSPEIVAPLVQGIIDIVVRAFAKEADEKDIAHALYTVIAAFTDDSAGYTKIPWHSAEQMGVYVKNYLAPGVAFEETETLAEILETGMGYVMAKVQEMILDYFKDPNATWDEHVPPQLTALRDYVVSVLLGTNTLTYDKKTLQDFSWQPVDDPDEGEEILSVGTEGGGLSICRKKTPEGWRYRVVVSEEGLYDEEDVLADLKARPWVKTWAAALKQLDKYPWPDLYPLDVHSSFANRVHKALKAREKQGITVDWFLWGQLLNIDIEDESE